ncbi:fatty acid 2-hydroxylase [Protopterus annectens]|uniref:fatty acid 2-hydroxylase n=1 Tax=Protopterus annectens TaxID=7888 RepID=UPI001CFB741F|nr:fatty acid 2-hydroxylase [Protopterus annectens]
MTSTKIFTLSEIHQRTSRGECLVIHRNKVYDVAPFVRMHPGGEQMIKQRAGQDITRTLESAPHRHSANAYRWLEQYYIGDLRGENHTQGQSLRKRETRSEDHYDPLSYELKCKTVDPKNDLVDWSKPLLWQVGHLKERYDEWVHQPVDRPIRLFYSDFVEACSKTAWYMVPLVWIPVIFFLCWRGSNLLSQDYNLYSSEFSAPVYRFLFPCCFVMGMFTWSFLEYSIHRFVFHMTPPANNYYLIAVHFMLHGQHHKSPYDDSRLVFPPVPASMVAGLFYGLLWFMLPEGIAVSLFVGGLTGYLIYDLVHYYLHYGSPHKGTYLYDMKAYHVKHHFEHQKSGFGITSKFWDYPFSTLIPEETFDEQQ